MQTKFLILGGGPAGLTVANKLKMSGIEDFILVEKEEEVGGLCRSEIVDGSPLDIGGGHILDVKRKNVNDFLFEFMPEDEWDLYNRISKINYNGTMLDHPFEANIWQMEIDDQVEFLKSIAEAGCVKGNPKPEKFVDWIRWKLGDKVTDEYMIPYNQKMFGENLDLLGTYWLEKLPDVSFEDTLRSCLERKAHGKEPGHTQFYYPKKYGYGEVWIRMGKNIEPNIILGKSVMALNVGNKEIVLNDQTRIKAEYIITTIPWTDIEIEDDVKLQNKVSLLKHTGVEIEYFGESMDTDAHWVYYPDADKSYHRILVRPNFCPGSKGYWTETNLDRVLLKKNTGEKQFINKYAYPLNTIGKNELMEEILTALRSKRIYGLGRWGEWQHFNSDVVVERSLKLADDIINTCSWRN